MTDKLDISDAIMILENEKPHCGEKMIFTEEHRCEAYDMAIQALEYDDTKYHREHGEVIVDKDVWEDAKKALEVASCRQVTGKLNDRAVSLNAVIDAVDRWIKDKSILVTLPTSEVTPLFERIHQLPSVGKDTNVSITDCISRQAVIDMAYDMSEIDGEHFNNPHFVVDVDDIKQLQRG